MSSVVIIDQSTVQHGHNIHVCPSVIAVRPYAYSTVFGELQEIRNCWLKKKKQRRSSVVVLLGLDVLHTHSFADCSGGREGGSENENRKEDKCIVVPELQLSITLYTCTLFRLYLLSFALFALHSNIHSTQTTLQQQQLLPLLQLES